MEQINNNAGYLRIWKLWSLTFLLFALSGFYAYFLKACLPRLKYLYLPHISICQSPHRVISSLTLHSFQTTLRVWDVLFYEGAKVLFHVALAIFKVNIFHWSREVDCYFNY